MAERELIPIINKQIDTHFAEDITMQQLEEKLTTFINDLIKDDFQRLVAILYKVDVEEDRLKKILRKEAGKDAASIIARLIIEREMQKIESRNQYKNKADQG